VHGNRASPGKTTITTSPRQNITKAEVSRSQGSKAKKYAIRGAIISAAIGAISLGYQHDTVGEDGSSVGEAAALGAFSGGLFRRTDRRRDRRHEERRSMGTGVAVNW
jgi:hypothetical protein